MDKLLRALAEAGHDVSVVAGIPTGSEPTFRPPASVTVAYVPFDPAPKSLFARRVKAALFGSSSPRWVHEAARKAADVAHAFRPGILFSSSTPIDSHLAALGVLKQFSLPWICSFSDPWPSRILPPPYRPSNPTVVVARASRVDLRHARRVLARACAVHMFSKYGLALLEKETRVPLTEKAHIIPHIGRTLLPPRKPDGQSRERPPLEGKWLVHFGGLNHWRFSQPMFEAITRVAASHPDQFGGLICVGFVSDDFKDLIRQRGWSDHVRFVPWTDQPTLPEDLENKAGAFLLVEADMPESPFVPSKLADYARSRRPILAVTPEVSATRDYLEQYEHSGVAVSHDREQIADAIKRLFGISSTDATYDGGSALADSFAPSHVAQEYVRMFRTLEEQHPTDPAEQS